MEKTREDILSIILKMREGGKSFEKIGLVLGLSRQRIHQIYKQIHLFTVKRNCVFCKKEIILISGREKCCSSCKKGSSDLYGRNLVREKIRIRDNWTCQICGEVWTLGKRRLDVHHKDCIKEKTKQYDNYEIEKHNMITLCHKCHLNLPEHKKTMSEAQLKKVKRG